MVDTEIVSGWKRRRARECEEGAPPPLSAVLFLFPTQQYYIIIIIMCVQLKNVSLRTTDDVYIIIVIG